MQGVSAPLTWIRSSVLGLGFVFSVRGLGFRVQAGVQDLV